MFNRYNLRVSYKGNTVFDGDINSINKLIKIACFFSDDCFMTAFDYLCEKQFTDYTLRNIIEEFKNGEIHI